MNARLSVSAVSSWQWTLDDDLRFWSEAGIDHVGLSLRKLEEAGIDAAVARIRDAGLRVSNIVELGWWDLADPATWPAQQDRLLGAVGAAAVFGSCLVLTTGPARGLDWDEAAAALDDAIDPVRSAALAQGVPLTVEHTGPLRLDLSFCTTLRDGVDLARRLGIGVCMEINSCFAERGLAGIIDDACTNVGEGSTLAHVQLSDFVIGSLCTPDRAVPGDGDIALAAVLAMLHRSSYSGAFEIEIVGPRIEAEGYASAIRRAVEHVDRLLVELPG